MTEDTCGVILRILKVVVIALAMRWAIVRIFERYSWGFVAPRASRLSVASELYLKTLKQGPPSWDEATVKSHKERLERLWEATPIRDRDVLLSTMKELLREQRMALDRIVHGDEVPPSC